MTKTKTEKVLTLLESGREFTASKIIDRTGIVNPSALIHQLRGEGYPIYTNKRRDQDGYVVYKYRMNV